MKTGRHGARRGTLLSLILVAFVAGETGRCPAQSDQSPRDQLQQYVTQLQANPTDDALRTKIIQLALTLDPKPAAPEEAVMDAAKALTIFQAAAKGGTPEDLKAAAAAFAQASQLAPWVPEYYYNEGRALEGAKQYDDAIHALNFYLVAAPNAPDAADVRGKIEGIKYARDKERAAVDAQQRQKQAELDKAQAIDNLLSKVRGIVGDDEFYWYVGSVQNPDDIARHIRSGTFEMGLTLQELGGQNNFWSWGHYSSKFVIQNGRIYLCRFRYDNAMTDSVQTEAPDPDKAEYVGTPNGPSVADIIWTARDSGKRVWAQFQEWNGRLLISPNRPIDSPDPGVKYSYWLYSRK